ncbi:MAG: cupin domain-containing protein, partial [Acidobacteriia bacterium]|nr:cupin domain-containing protein [Terriglobia bacterium]
MKKNATSSEAWRKHLFDGLLRGIRLQSSIYFRPEFRAPWGVSITRDCAVFHIVARGTCCFQVKGSEEPMELAEGDFVVVTRGAPHQVRDQASSRTVNFFELANSHMTKRNGTFGFGGDGALTRLVCGGMQFEDSALSPLLRILPPVLHVNRT